jgi:hypothetical protein
VRCGPAGLPLFGLDQPGAGQFAPLITAQSPANFSAA